MLIIDDNEMDSFVTKIVVERVKLADSVVCVSNAYNALEYIQNLKTKVEKEQIPLDEICVFLDIMMPYMDANAFLSALDKIWPSLVQRIFIVSGLPLDEQNNLILRQDIGGFLAKPLTEEKLRKSFSGRE